MSEEQKYPRLARAIDTADRPLLVLAVIAVAIYMLELRAVFVDADARRVLRAATIAMDGIFCADVALKLFVYRGRYLRSPWFLVDVLSCLPAIAVLTRVPHLRAVRFIRFFRVLRILRTLRLLRALHSIPALGRSLGEEQDDRAARRLARAMNASVLTYSAIFLGIIHHIRVTQQHDARAAEIEFFLVLGAMVAIFMFVVIMHFQLEDVSAGQLRALLNIALPRQVAEHFFHHPHSYGEKHRMPATILFMDFVGFTRVSEELASDVPKLSQHLERAMDCVVAELATHDLIIDKFIGDSIMSFRGGPLVVGTAEEHAARVVRGALAGDRALRALKDPHFGQLKIGGASTTECLIGAFGTSSRLSYTVLGDGVNLAARLEPASAQCRTQNLFCERTRNLCGDEAGVVWRRWGRIRVKGKLQPLAVFEALDVGAGGGWVAAFERGLAAYEARDFKKARGCFSEADALRPGGDPPSQLYMSWCDGLAVVPPDWEPVLTTHK
jgi:class 3 adenylate cyclase